MNYKTTRGYLTDKERQYLFDIAKESDTIINVGIEYGASVHCFRQGNPNVTIIAIDLIGNQKFEGEVNAILLFEEEDFAFPKDYVFPENFFTSEESFVVFIEGNSNTINIEAKSDLIFVDGCHWGECLQNDIEKYSALATKYLLFHDYSDDPPHKGVKQALDNWQSEHFVKIDQIDTLAVYKRKDQ